MRNIPVSKDNTITSEQKGTQAEVHNKKLIQVHSIIEHMHPLREH